MSAADLIDEVLRVVPGSELDRVRRGRAAARDNSEAAYQALLNPREDGGVTQRERYAVASFAVALHAGEQPSPLAAVYDGELARHDAALAAAVAQQAALARRPGPYGVYREPGLAAESEPGPVFAADPALGERLAAALTHTALLVLRPRESSPQALQALLDAGWTTPQIVTLSQLVAFLSYQIRLTHGLAVLEESR